MRQLTKSLYTVTPLDDRRWEVKLSDASHPVFVAHFPNNPLLPAFLQIDIFTEILDKSVVSIERCKFKLPILPNDTIIYEIVKQTENNYRIKIKKEDAVVSEIRISVQ